MRNVIQFPRFRSRREVDQGLRRQVAQLLEAADEALAQDRLDLRDSLVEKARQMAADLDTTEVAA